MTWGDSPYKNVVSLDALLELIQVGALSEGFVTDYHLLHCLGWVQNGPTRALSMETIQAHERLLDIPGMFFSEEFISCKNT